MDQFRTDFVPARYSRSALALLLCAGLWCGFVLLTSHPGGLIERAAYWAIPRLRSKPSPALMAALSAKGKRLQDLTSQAVPLFPYQDVPDATACPLHKVALVDGCSQRYFWAQDTAASYLAQRRAFFPYSRLRIFEWREGHCWGGGIYPVEKAVQFCPLCRVLDEAWSPNEWCKGSDDCLSLAIVLASSGPDRTHPTLFGSIMSGEPLGNGRVDLGCRFRRPLRSAVQEAEVGP